MKQQSILLSIIVFATLTRVAIPPLFGHLPNFSALDALALFCGAYCDRRVVAVGITLASVWVGDMLLTHTLFYDGFYWQYGCYALISLMGTSLGRSPGAFFAPGDGASFKLCSRVQKTHPGYMPLAFASAILFFIISNFGVWFSGSLYPQTLEGLVACYVAAIPFFKNTLVSDLVFSGVLFGAMHWIPAFARTTRA